MKIVCDACQAKYSISDDKVTGKVFKIRCKKCSNIIVVRGAAASPPAAQEKETRVYDYGHETAAAADDAVWHVVINQDQVGPLTAAEIEQRFTAGEIDGETFTWREGLADWLPLAHVDAFAAIATRGTAGSESFAANATRGTAGSDAVSALFGGGDDTRSDAGDLFAASSTSSRGRGDAGDVFAAASTSGRSRDAGAQLESGGADAQSAAAQKLRGERNESSVLFSLNNLSALAENTRRPAVSSSGTPATGAATGAAAGEGSGLIDIRSMANVYMGGSGAGGAVAKPSSAIGSIDDLPVFGGSGFSEPAVIMPAARAAPNHKVLYLMIGAVALLAVAAIVMMVMLLKGDSAAKQVAVVTPEPKQAGSDPTAVPPANAVTPTNPATNATTNPATSATTTATTSATTSATTNPTTNGTTNATTNTTTNATTNANATSNSRATKVVPKTPKTPTSVRQPAQPALSATTKAETCDQVSCVVNGFEGECCAKFRKDPPKTNSNPNVTKSNLPASLDSSMVSTGIARVKARAMTCGDRSNTKGKVTLKVSVAGSGSVTNVAVESTPDPALGACVAAAVQKASFASTQSGGSFRVPFTF